MYAPPEENDLKALSGRTAEMVCFAANCVYIHLSNNALLSIEGTFRLQTEEGDSDTGEASFPLSGSKLMRIVGQKTDHVQSLSDGTLILYFTNGDILTVSGDNGPYEAYHIRYGDREITI